MLDVAGHTGAPVAGHSGAAPARSPQRAANSRYTHQKPAGSPVRFEEVPAGDSSDEATQRTVRKMTDYIRSSAADPGVAAAAEYAARHFAIGGDSAASLAWAVFWYVKHCLKFRQDEATMFRIGRQNEQDLLIAPDVLVRMQDPSEDCDGFSMLTAALLTILGVPVYIVTIAANPGEPDRWSHVFVIAMVNGRVMPLDTSHGSGPGWMVPRDRIYRWQAWDLDGRKVDIAPSSFQVHGYVRRGLGTCDYEGDPTCSAPVDPGVFVPPVFFPPGGSGGGGTGSGTQLNPTPGGYVPVVTPAPSDPWSFLASLIGTAGKVASVAETPTTTITLPNGTVVQGISAQSAGSLLSSSSMASMLPILGIAAVALIAFSLLGRKK